VQAFFKLPICDGRDASPTQTIPVALRGGPKNENRRPWCQRRSTHTNFQWVLYPVV